MFVKIKGLNIYYETAGSGEPFVLLHGWGANTQTMRPIFDHLRATKKFQIFSLDFPGFGMSDSPHEGWSVNDYSEMIIAFFDRFDLQNVNIIGHSFGGRIGIKLAVLQRQRIKRLILVDSAGIRPKRTARYYANVYFTKLMRVALRALPISLGKHVENSLLSKLGSEDYRNATGSMKQTFAKVVNEDLRDYLPEIRIPTMIIWGEKDTTTPVEDAVVMNQLIPSSKLQILKGAGHYSYLDAPNEFDNAVAKFMNEDVQ